MNGAFGSLTRRLGDNLLTIYNVDSSMQRWQKTSMTIYSTELVGSQQTKQSFSVTHGGIRILPTKGSYPPKSRDPIPVPPPSLHVHPLLTTWTPLGEPECFHCASLSYTSNFGDNSRAYIWASSNLFTMNCKAQSVNSALFQRASTTLFQKVLVSLFQHFLRYIWNAANRSAFVW